MPGRGDGGAVSRLGSLAALSGACDLRENAADRCSFAAAMHAIELDRDGPSIMQQLDAGADWQPGFS